MFEYFIRNHRSSSLTSLTGTVFKTACAVLVIAGLLVASGCATPVGVGYLDQQESYRRLTANVLTHSTLSAPTMQILNRNGLAERFKNDPAGAIAAIHKGAATENEADRLYALAELSFLHAERSSDRSYYLAAAVYAYALLFPKHSMDRLDGFDPRFRTAIEIYNLGIAEGFTSPDGQVVLSGGTYKLPFGELTVSADPDKFIWSSYRLVSFINASRLSIRGLRNEYRWPGIGAALIAKTLYVPGMADPVISKVPQGIKVAVTALVRLDDPRRSLRKGTVSGKLDLYTTDGSSAVDIEGQKVPLEFDISSALAYTLEGSGVYDTETKGFFSGTYKLFRDPERFKENIFFMSPYKKGRIPVVFIHGTASSSARWIEMLNELENDRRLWGRYQYWSFTYNTGNPILYTGGLLAEGLKEIVQKLDPAGTDPALRQMIVVGHSQGGMLARLTVVDSGMRFWDNAAPDTPYDSIQASAETKEMVTKSLFYKPLPFVRRVVFISTPHRGSYVAGGWIGRMAGKFISVPFYMVNALKDVATLNPGISDILNLKNIPKSTDNMDPNSPFVRVFSSTPISPDVAVHSIISVKNPEAPKEKWNDGVVQYSSAHLDVGSELVVHSGHSTQGEPATIEEVRRILLLNIGIQ